MTNTTPIQETDKKINYTLDCKCKEFGGCTFTNDCPIHNPNYKERRRKDKEIVICAAIKTTDGIIARGHRHSDCYRVLVDMGISTKRADGEQGFITSKNRFVTREEGRVLQDAAGIKSVDREGYRGKTLFSEDLY